LTQCNSGGEAEAGGKVRPARVKNAKPAELKEIEVSGFDMVIVMFFIFLNIAE
jgi:hypothetical protein